MRVALLLGILCGTLHGMCAKDAHDVALPAIPKGSGKSVLIVRLANGKILKTETPYFTGVGHPAMQEYIEDNHGGIREILFAGETVTTADGKVYVKDTSRLNSPDFRRDYNHNDLKNYAKFAGAQEVHERPRIAGEYNLYPELNGLDARLNTKATDNIKHDIIMPEVVGLSHFIEAGIEVKKNRKDIRNKALNVMKGPVFDVIFELIERDGANSDRLRDMSKRLGDKKPLADADWLFFRETLQHYFHFQNRPGEPLPEEVLNRLVNVQTLSEP